MITKSSGALAYKCRDQGIAMGADNDTGKSMGQRHRNEAALVMLIRTLSQDLKLWPWFSLSIS